ncbi:hypothetical protein [Galactobacillus timonensis]|uniref:hypothetical protein n=1 Tax=Galactobacillus timonensis TaxID=2041840 RepID=UPI000C8452A8|nr:hypothetical protein [Galactobacillus timonensis]
MKKSRSLLKPAQLLFGTALVLFLIQGVFRDTLLVSAADTNRYLVIIRILYLFSLALLAVKILFFQDFLHSSFFHSIYFWIFTILLAISTWISRNPALFSVWLFALASADTDYDAIVRITFFMETILISSIVILSFAGILPTETYPPATGHPFTRYSFGFLHPNSMGLYIFHVACCFIYLRRRKSAFPSFLILTAITLFNYVVTSSRTSCIASTLLLISLALYKYLSRERVKNREKKLHTLSCFLVAGAGLTILASIIMSFFYDHPFIQKIDFLFSGRFFYISKAFSENGLSWFGKAPFSIGGPFDNSYMWILLHYGILTYISVSILFIFLLYCLRKNKQCLEVIILFVYSCYAMMESEIFVPNKCVFVLLFGIFFINNFSVTGIPKPDSKDTIDPARSE